MAQLPHRHDHRRDGQFDVDPVQQGRRRRSHLVEHPARHPRRVAQRTVGQHYVLIQHGRPGQDRDLEPGVAHLGRDDQQSSQGRGTQGGATLGPRPAQPRDQHQRGQYDRRSVADRERAAAQRAFGGEHGVEADRRPERDPPSSGVHSDRREDQPRPRHRRRLGSGDVVADQAVQRSLEPAAHRDDLQRHQRDQDRAHAESDERHTCASDVRRSTGQSARTHGKRRMNSEPLTNPVPPPTNPPPRPGHRRRRPPPARWRW